ncbi:Reproductive homeobox 1 [Apodemus speciosus]|uniref:Reproductive homeobox 1 n=1 Tax=Apodemus speciosus TaxID=105296 RepID=A0ABQ0FTY6_APOSI
MDRHKIHHPFHVGPAEDEGNVRGARARMVSPPAGEGGNEGERGRGQPGSEAAAAEGEGAEEISAEGAAAGGDAGFMSHWDQEGLGAHRRHVWANVRQAPQPVFRCVRGTWGMQPGQRLKGKNGSSNRFAHWQLRELELVFQRTHYLSAGVRKRLAAYLGVCEAKVHNWFKKKRALYRKYHNS